MIPGPVVPGPVVLTTDFGLADPYVAEVKAALLAQWARWPAAASRPAIVDLSHGVPPGDVAAGAWLLERTARRFPPGAVHLAVVDPGVGTERPAVAAVAGGRAYVGPGNGLLAFLCAEPDLAVTVLDAGFAARALGREPAPTFHGRDLFAVAAAHLAMGVPAALLGAAGGPDALGEAPGACGRIVWIDRFGNAVSDVPAPGSAREVRVLLDGRPLAGPYATFGAAPADTPFWYRGSGGTVEFAVREAHGAERCGWRPGLPVRIEST